MTRYGMAIDMDHCIGCQTCVVSCQMNHALRPGSARNGVDTLEWGRWPDGDLAFFPHACIHCDDPLCVRVCPTGASNKRTDGVVVIDQDLCIGCGVCITACEYGARTINAHDGFHFGANSPAPYEAEGIQPLGVADKCTFCCERIDRGQLPACVQDCVAHVRAFGDLDDPASSINAFIAEHACTAVPGSALFYQCGHRDLDVKNTLTARYFVSSKQDRSTESETGPSFNPIVLGVAGATTAAVAFGLGASAKHSRNKKRQDAQGDDHA